MHFAYRPLLLLLTLALAQLSTPATAQGTAIKLPVERAVAIQQLHYRKMYEAKPFPDATLTYYANGVYRIVSKGEDHYGVYVLQGDFGDETYTVRYVSLPSPDWGDKTAFHQLTFINQQGKSGIFIQNAIIDTGEAIAQQNGQFSTTFFPVGRSE